MAFSKRSSFLLGAGYYLVVSLAIILFASPLFRSLGFEYSGLISLAVSIHILYFSTHQSGLKKREGYLSILKSLWLPIFVLCNIPLIVSAVSSLFIPNCSLADGLIFYIEIVYPTTLIAMLCGILVGNTERSRLRMNIYLAVFWISTFILSLLPGYFSAKIYTYGWQYGYFPGLVWDEAMELTSGYWWSRVIEVFLIIKWLIHDQKFIKEGGHRSRAENKLAITKMFYSWQFWLMILSSTIFGELYSSQCSDSSLERFLPNTENIGAVLIHYCAASLQDDELTLIKYDVKNYVNEIDSIYQIKNPSEVDIYIFPNIDDLYKYVGTREASITKPWKRSIYIAKQNLQSLKHELAHALLSDYGSFPFDMSWSTGLTEGSAVAIEDNYDGIHSAEELSAQVLQMNFANGISNVMQPSGFLSSAPSTSYVLSGSFSKYIISQFGAEKFLKVYKERDFNDVYRVSLSELESDWKNQLKKIETPMDHYDSLRTIYYFKRTSILRQPCLRRIGKLIKNADEAFKIKGYKHADSLYAEVIKESGRLKAIRGRVLCQLHLNNPNAALAILDTTASAREINNLSALRMLRGDVTVLATGDISKAKVEWQEAMRLELGENSFLASFMRLYFLGSTDNILGIQKILRDLYGINEIKDKYELVFEVNPKSSEDKAFYIARLYLYTSYVERTGRLAEAYKIWSDGLKDIGNISREKSEALTMVSGEDLFLRLIRKRYSGY